MKNKIKAVSTLLTVLLILASLILGAAIAYMWVMANFYNIPENATLLSVEDVSFPTGNFSYFNVTVLNPSYSLSDANLTAFRVNIEDKNVTFTINTTEPSLPYMMGIGTKQSFKFLENWSHLSGETIRIEPLAQNASIKSYPYTAPKVSLTITPDFNVSDSIERFNLTLKSAADSAMNLTVSSITASGYSVTTEPLLSNVSALQPGGNQTFVCYWNWENRQGQNVTVKVATAEGFEQNYTISELAGASLIIDEITFDYTDTSYFNITLESLESTATVWLDTVNMTMQDNTTIILDTSPSLHIVPIPVPANQTLSLKCLWDWGEHRNETISIKVYTKQGFTVPSKTTKTPPSVIWEIDQVEFDLDDLEHFSVNVTNLPSSLLEINITKIEFNSNITSMNPLLIAAGSQATINCGFDWKDYVGKNVTIKVHVTYGLNDSSATKGLALPFMKMTNVSFSSSPSGNPYFNVTIKNSQFSGQDITLTQLSVRVGNLTYTVDGTITGPRISPGGYILAAGTEVTIACPWDWTQHVGKDITVVAETAQGIQVTTTLRVE